MALNVVNLDEGIYVELAGVIEIFHWKVRYTSDFCDPPESEDFMDFQEKWMEIPRDFCKKDRNTGVQAAFHCIVCNCDLRDVDGLRNHVMGEKHVRKALDYKCQVMGIDKQPLNAPKEKKIKRGEVSVDVSLSLEQRLCGSAQPAPGLEYVREYWNPREMTAHPMYTCTLEGCKSAWGTSDDMFHHVTKDKHQKNFFKKLYPGDQRVAQLSKDKVLTEAAEWEEDLYPDGDRDYSCIVQVRDYEKYKELRNRPSNWSEKKASLGISNSNMEPLGSNRKRSQLEEDSIFDQEAWRDWRPKSRDQAVAEAREYFSRGVDDVRDLVDNFNGKRGDADHEEVLFYGSTHKRLLEMLREDLGQEEVGGLIGQLDAGMEVLQEKLDVEERQLKTLTRLMDELEEEIKSYYSDRTSNKYKNIQERMVFLAENISTFKPSTSELEVVKTQYNSRLTKMWKDFEMRSDSLVERLQQQMGADNDKGLGESGSSRTLGHSLAHQMGGPGGSEQGELDPKLPSMLGDASHGQPSSREIAVEEYRKQLTNFVRIQLEVDFSEKFLDNEASRYADYLVRTKYLEAEVHKFVQKSGGALVWEHFKLMEETKHSVKRHLEKQMASYTLGQVNQKVW